MKKCDTCDNMTDNIWLLSGCMDAKFIEKYGDITHITCDDCMRKEAIRIGWENKQTNDYPTCPACGYCTNHCESYEYDRYNFDEQCQECGEWYVVTANHTVTFTTKRIRKD